MDFQDVSMMATKRLKITCGYRVGPIPGKKLGKICRILTNKMAPNPGKFSYPGNRLCLKKKSGPSFELRKSLERFLAMKYEAHSLD